MRDWRETLRERLGSLGLDPERESEILEELASHFEDCSAPDALALLERSDWRELRHEIRRVELEEVPMTQRTRSLWLPGLLTGALAWGLFRVLETVGVDPNVFWWREAPMMFFLPWTLALPFIGALGAHSSRAKGGRIGERLLAAVFPAIAFSVFTAVAVAIRWVNGSIPIPPVTVLFVLLSWVVVPAVALLVGALPFVVRRVPPRTA
jgi:hypothetical protein